MLRTTSCCGPLPTLMAIRLRPPAGPASPDRRAFAAMPSRCASTCPYISYISRTPWVLRWIIARAHSRRSSGSVVRPVHKSLSTMNGFSSSSAV